jgi:hypothetical protein
MRVSQEHVEHLGMGCLFDCDIIGLKSIVIGRSSQPQSCVSSPSTNRERSIPKRIHVPRCLYLAFANRLLETLPTIYIEPKAGINPARRAELTSAPAHHVIGITSTGRIDCGELTAIIDRTSAFINGSLVSRALENPGAPFGVWDRPSQGVEPQEMPRGLAAGMLAAKGYAAAESSRYIRKERPN